MLNGISRFPGSSLALQTYDKRMEGFSPFRTSPIFRVRSLPKVPIAAMRVTGDLTGCGAETYSPGGEDALVLYTPLIATPVYDTWIGGRYAPSPPVKAGETVLLNMNVEMGSFVDFASDALSIYLPRCALNALADEQGVARIESFHIQSNAPVDDTVIRHLGGALLPVLEHPEDSSRLFADHIAMALLAHAAHTYCGMRTENRIRRGGLAPWQERRAKELLAARLDGEVTLEELARECRLSRAHFARAFKVTTGVPPHRWLLARRIEQARELLLGTALQIGEIAQRSGFADQSHLTRAFRKATGVGPGEWRRLRRA